MESAYMRVQAEVAVQEVFGKKILEKTIGKVYAEKVAAYEA
jgi:hypothetical protein